MIGESPNLLLRLASFAALNISLFSATDVSGEDKLLINVIQLVVLTIPLLTLPLILKSSSALLGKVGNMTDSFNKAMRIDKGLEKGQAGLKDTAKKRASFAGSLASERLQNSDRFGGKPADFIKGIGGRRRDAAARAKQRELYVNARRQSREADVQSKSTEGLAQGATGQGSRLANAIAGSQDTRLQDYMVSAQKEERDKQVAAIQGRFVMSNTSANEIADALRHAIESGDHETATAAINRLSEMGVGGTEAVSKVLQGEEVYSGQQTLGGPVDSEMQTTVSAAVNSNSNYGSLVEKSGDVAKGGFDASGNFKGDFHKLSSQQVAALSEPALKRYHDELASIVAATPAGAPVDKRVADAKAHVNFINGNEALRGRITDARSEAHMNDILTL